MSSMIISMRDWPVRHERQPCARMKLHGSEFTEGTSALWSCLFLYSTIRSIIIVHVIQEH